MDVTKQMELSDIQLNRRNRHKRTDCTIANDILIGIFIFRSFINGLYFLLESTFFQILFSLSSLLTLPRDECYQSLFPGPHCHVLQCSFISKQVVLNHIFRYLLHINAFLFFGSFFRNINYVLLASFLSLFLQPL